MKSPPLLLQERQGSPAYTISHSSTPTSRYYPTPYQSIAIAVRHRPIFATVEVAECWALGKQI